MINPFHVQKVPLLHHFNLLLSAVAITPFSFNSRVHMPDAWRFTKWFSLPPVFYFHVKSALREKMWSTYTMRICSRPKILRLLLRRKCSTGSVLKCWQEFSDIICEDRTFCQNSPQWHEVSCFATGSFFSWVFAAGITGYCAPEYVLLAWGCTSTTYAFFDCWA